MIAPRVSLADGQGLRSRRIPDVGPPSFALLCWRRAGTTNPYAMRFLQKGPEVVSAASPPAVRRPMPLKTWLRGEPEENPISAARSPGRSRSVKIAFRIENQLFEVRFCTARLATEAVQHSLDAVRT